jgi:hypothetical protein
MTQQAHLRVPPADFASWSRSKRDEWFAEGAAAYRAAKTVGASEPPRESNETEKAAPKVSLIRASDITPEPIQWLWSGFLAAGKMHILGGAPGSGKTTISMAFAATVSNGGYWPDGTRAAAGNVFIWSGEDDPSDTLIPRLIAAGASRERCFFVGDVRDAGKKRSFDPAKDTTLLADAIRKAGGAALIVVAMDWMDFDEDGQTTLALNLFPTIVGRRHWIVSRGMVSERRSSAWVRG